MASEAIRARTLLACREHLLTINRENISPTIGLKLKKPKTPEGTGNVNSHPANITPGHHRRAAGNKVGSF